MNSVLQCLLNTPGWLAEACRNFKVPELKESSCSRRLALGQGFAELVLEYSSMEGGSLSRKNKALANLKAAIADLDDQYAGCQQQDAYEFLGCLLEGLEDNFRMLFRGTDSDQVCPPVSIIRAVCGVMTHTKRTCHSCGTGLEVDQVTDSALRLPLISPAAQMDAELRKTEEALPISVEELLKCAQAPETIDGYECDECRRLSGERGTEYARSTITQHACIMSETRDVLIVVLYRFFHGLDESGKFKQMKVRRQVACPTVLSLHGSEYHMFGMVSHIGSSLTAGHYIAATRSVRDSMWYECNDELVRPLQLSALYDGRAVTAIRSDADPYILFYHRNRDENTQEVTQPEPIVEDSGCIPAVEPVASMATIDDNATSTKLDSQDIAVVGSVVQPEPMEVTQDEPSAMDTGCMPAIEQAASLGTADTDATSTKQDSAGTAVVGSAAQPEPMEVVEHHSTAADPSCAAVVKEAANIYASETAVGARILDGADVAEFNAAGRPPPEEAGRAKKYRATSAMPDVAMSDDFCPDSMLEHLLSGRPLP